MSRTGQVERPVDAAQADFFRAVGAILDAYAWFDFNLGLKIKHWSRDDDKSNSVLRADVPMNHRLGFLRAMVAASDVAVSAKERAAWVDWLAEVESIRAFRNDYAHGRWIRQYNEYKATLTWRFAPLTWSSETAQRPPVELTIEELDDQAEQIRRVEKAMARVAAPFFEVQGGRVGTSSGAANPRDLES